MKVGIPTEIKNNENRVAATPAGVHELVRRGHEVLVQEGAGLGSSITDADYVEAGATIVATADEVWGAADLLLKVKEPIAEEYPRMRPGQTLFTYLHLAASRPCTDALVASGTTAIAYETVQLPNRQLPLLQPMSEVAGRLSTQVGAYHLMRAAGGRGILLGGVPGTPKARVVDLGGGVAGEHAAANALGMGADVTIIDLSIPRLRELEIRFGGQVQTRVSSAYEIAAQLKDADLVIGSVLIPGAQAPKLVTDAMVATMKKGSVLVDIAIDHGQLLRGIPRHHARRPHLRRARQRLLLRRQHAGRCAGDLDARAHERDAAVRDRARRDGVEAGPRGGSRARPRPQRARRARHELARRGGARHAADAGRGRARRLTRAPTVAGPGRRGIVTP